MTNAICRESQHISQGATSLHVEQNPVFRGRIATNISDMRGATHGESQRHSYLSKSKTFEDMRK